MARSPQFIWCITGGAIRDARAGQHKGEEGLTAHLAFPALQTDFFASWRTRRSFSENRLDPRISAIRLKICLWQCYLSMERLSRSLSPHARWLVRCNPTRYLDITRKGHIFSVPYAQTSPPVPPQYVRYKKKGGKAGRPPHH